MAEERNSGPSPLAADVLYAGGPAAWGNISEVVRWNDDQLRQIAIEENMKAVKRHTEEVAVGDLDSNKRGSGARKNSGKERMDLIPVRYWISVFGESGYIVEQPDRWYDGLRALRDFQEGDNEALARFLASADLDDAVKVFEFGANKYAMWNWAKGMPWSVCFGCCLRHAKRRLVFDEQFDQDSGETHWGHFICNLIMLDWYVRAYPEGDDRPLFEE